VGKFSLTHALTLLNPLGVAVQWCTELGDGVVLAAGTVLLAMDDGGFGANFSW
jgi:hypothetical protein